MEGEVQDRLQTLDIKEKDYQNLLEREERLSEIEKDLDEKASLIQSQKFELEEIQREQQNIFEEKQKEFEKVLSEQQKLEEYEKELAEKAELFEHEKIAAEKELEAKLDELNTVESFSCQIRKTKYKTLKVKQKERKKS